MMKAVSGLMAEGQFVPLFGGKVFVPAGHFAETELLSGGMPEAHVIKTLQRLLRPDDTAIDIGANIGFTALAMAEAVGLNGKVYAIEADPEIAISTRQTFAASGAHNITLLPIAASDTFGFLHATLSSSSNTAFGHISNGLEGHFRKTAVSLPLDKIFNERIDLIKIDIEGAEYAALKGMSRIISTCKPIVLSEFSPAYMAQSLGRDLSSEFHAIFAELSYSCKKLETDGTTVDLPDFAALIAAYEQDRDGKGFGHIDVVFVPAA